jgi:hypothetical protein
MFLTQKSIDLIFEQECHVMFPEDCSRICQIIFDKYKITISQSQADEFWRWRSEELDASFLILEPPSEICKWFEKFVMHRLKEKSKTKIPDIQKWNDYKKYDDSKTSQSHCPVCGLDLRNPLGYVCPSTKCPTGLAGPRC